MVYCCRLLLRSFTESNDSSLDEIVKVFASSTYCLFKLTDYLLLCGGKAGVILIL